MGHMGHLETQKGGRDTPGEPKGRSKAPLGHHSYHFWVLVSMFLNNIHYRISTMPNYLRINKHYALMPTLATPATTQTATNKKGAGGRGEAFIYIYIYIEYLQLAVTVNCFFCTI